MLYAGSATADSVWVFTVVPSTWTSSTASNGAVTELFRYQYDRATLPTGIVTSWATLPV